VWRVKALLLAVLLTGCYSATIHLSPNHVDAPPDLPDAWHVSLFGVIELSDPVPLGICPYGPNLIEENMSILGSLFAGLVGVEIMDTAVTCEPAPPLPQAPPGPPGGL
jgi:hypothetical protein